MPTIENLKAAFAGESQANRKYLAFAKKAEGEGFPQVAKLFRAAAAAETVHAHGHLRVMGGVRKTAANLEEALKGEQYEFETMYPAFIKEAAQEKNKAAVMSFEGAMAVEKEHHAYYSEAIKSVIAGNDIPAATYFICGVCGHTARGGAPDKCPVCGAPKSQFTEVA
jgi:rubrerythrin